VNEARGVVTNGNAVGEKTDELADAKRKRHLESLMRPPMAMSARRTDLVAATQSRTSWTWSPGRHGGRQRGRRRRRSRVRQCRGRVHL